MSAIAALISVTVLSYSSYSTELGRAHSINATRPESCAGVYIDVGAHQGGTLWDFYMRPNCYEVCGGDRTCRPGNWSVASCTFCSAANSARQCAWMYPWWLPLSVRRTYCGIAFEPNPNVATKLSARVEELRAAVPGLSLRVVDMAVSVREGEAQFGIDEGAYEGRASSLALSRKSPRKPPTTAEASGKRPVLGEAVEVGKQRVISVRTLDVVRYLKGLRAKSVGMALDAEGAEFEMLRDLLLSGALCAKVDDLWLDWHPTRISWSQEKLPTLDIEMHKIYKWMLSTVENSAKHKTGTADPESHCKTVMYTVGQ